MNVVMMTMLPMHSFVQLNLIKIKADARVWIDRYFFLSACVSFCATTLMQSDVVGMALTPSPPFR